MSEISPYKSKRDCAAGKIPAQRKIRSPFSEPDKYMAKKFAAQNGSFKYGENFAAWK